MSEKDIAEDPDSLQSLAAKKINKSPQMKARFEKIEKLVTEMAYGPQALSQEELDKHAATGKDMQEFHKNRNKRVENFRNERLSEIASLLVMLPDIKQMLPEYFKNEAEKKSTQSKKDVVRKGKKVAPKPEKKVVSEEEKTADELRADIDKYMGM